MTDQNQPTLYGNPNTIVVATTTKSTDLLGSTAREPLAKMIEREDTRQKRKRKIRWILLALVPVIAFGVWYFLSPKPVPIPQRFRTGTVATGSIIREVKATGSVDAVTTVQIGAEVSGRIYQVPVDFNTKVHAGDVLARIDPELLQAEVDQANGQVIAAQAALDQAISNRDLLGRNLVRSNALFEQHLLAASDLDSDTSNLRVAAENVEAARANLKAMQGNLSVARTNLRHSVIRSQINGIVVARNIDSGQTIASVFQTPVLFSVAADLKQMQVVAAVDEADIGEVVEGQNATFTVNAYPDRTFKGIVTQVRNAPTEVEDVVTYGAVITVNNFDLALKPGMTATVTIVTAQAQNKLKVPNAALHFTPPGQQSDPTSGVWVLNNETFRRIHIRPGITDGEWTEVRSGDITAGTNVLVELTPEGKKAYAK